MATNKPFAKKGRMIKEGRQTKWAPVWAILKKFGKKKRIHPSVITHKKRSWRRTNMKA